MATGNRTLSIFFLCFLFMAIISSCSKKDGGFEISGTLENVTDNHLFISHEKGDSIIIDTVSIDNKGKFSYKAKVDTITAMSLYFNKNTQHIYVLVDKNWDVKLKGDVLYPDLIEVKGGEINDDLTEFKKTNKELLKSRADILKEAEKSTSENDSLIVKDYVVELKNINFELANVAENYIKANPSKIASVMLINTFFKDEASIPRLDETLGLLRGKAVDFPLTADLIAFRDKVKLSAIGSYAPHFSLKDTKGENIQLMKYRGKYVLLTFAATTCDICRDEKPEAIKIYNELQKEKKNIEFITIVKDIEQTPLSKNLSDSVKWPVVPVEGGWSAKVFESYYIREIPYSILISPTGYILERDLHISSIPKKLDDAIAGSDENKK